MSNNKDFKVKNGIQPTSYFEGMGTVVSGSFGDAYSLTDAAYDGVSFSVAAQETVPTGLFFKPDGTKMYVVGYGGNNVNEYDLSTAWDITTAVYLQNFSVAAQDTVTMGLFFKPDGTKMYVVGYGGRDINEYDLSTAWDISTASYLQLFSVAAQESQPRGLFFKPDGTKMYIIGQDVDDVNEYDLSTAWDISTAVYLQLFSVAAQEASATGLFFKPDGTKMYVIGYAGDDVNEYDLSTAWDISTAVYLQNFSVAAQETTPEGLFFKPDGTKMYVIGQTGRDINEYSLVLTTAELDLSTGSVFEITPTSDTLVTLGNPADSGTVSGATLLVNCSYDADTLWNLSTALYSQNFSVAAQDTFPTGLSFKPDGTKMYVLGQTGDDVNEYDLSTAWDISTAVYLQNFSVAAQEANPEGLFFKPDGTKMYVIGPSEINEYDLSTAWDVSTAVYLQLFSVATQESIPTGLFFKPDGTKMYVIGNIGDDVNEYDLSTAWDISTAVYLQNFSVAAQDTSPNGLFFKPDGTKMYVVGEAGVDVNEYDLSTAWDISTASYLQNFSVAAQETVPEGLFFKPDGTKMYVIGRTGDDVNEYDLGSATTITYARTLQWSGGGAPLAPVLGDTDVITFNTIDGGASYKAALAIDGAS